MKEKDKFGSFIKRVCAIFASFAFAFIAIFSAERLTARADTGIITLTSDASAVSVGDKFTVTLTVKSDVPVSGLETYITYPASLAKFISADEGITGSNGILKVDLLDSDEGETWNSFEIRFKARNTGDFRVKFADAVHLYSYASGEELSISTSPVTITIKADTGASDDTYLQAIKVGGETLTPAFDKNTRNYYVSVENDVKSLVISAIPNDSAATVAVSGNKGFKVGSDNIIKISVTAPSGNTSEYTIQVTRKSKSKEGTESKTDSSSEDPLMSELNPGLTSDSAVNTSGAGITNENVTGSGIDEGTTGSTVASDAITSGNEAITNGNTSESAINNPFPSVKINESGAKVIRSVIIALAVVIVLLVIFSIIYLFTKKKE